jgi:hypothetical protein
MLTEAHKGVCRQAVEKFGRRHQALKVVEELRELADEAAVEGFGSAERSGPMWPWCSISSMSCS